VSELVASGSGSVLAVDADPNFNLGLLLGQEVTETVADIREDFMEKKLDPPTGMSKERMIEYGIQKAVQECEGFDLLTMGRPEGPGCYCAVNHNLREVVDSISKSYRYVVIDNEAGMEHLSRRTTRDVEHLLVVTDPTQRGIMAAERIAEMREELDIRIENAYLILNRLVNGIPEPLQARIDQLDIPFVGVIPANDELTAFEFNGRPLVELGDNSPVYQAVVAILENIL